MFGLAPHLIVINASQKHLFVPLPQFLVKLVRAFLGGRRRVWYWRAILDLGSFDQLRNPGGNLPARLQGDAFPIHDSRDAMGGRVNENVIGGYVVVKKGECFSVAAGLSGEENREDGE